MAVVRVGLPPDVALDTPSAGDSRWIVTAVLLCVAVPLAIFAPTFAKMVATWERSETFAHCFFVFPAFVYLIWRQRAELRSCPVRPAPLALVGVFVCGFVVALGSLAAALTPGFFGLIGVSIFTVIAVLGWRLAWVIWVPLLFLFFAVPFGEVFVPSMIEWTADFTVAALAASGVPVFREGPNFVIPSGSWSVVDACSGIRYLLASMFAGWLYAWLIYRSLARRLAFMAASIVVPVVANWLRAYIIVMLAHLSGNKIATGVDHLIYGWVFFGIVIGLMFWTGSFFRDDSSTAGSAGAVDARLSFSASAPRWLAFSVAIAAVLLAAGWQSAMVRLAEAGDKRPVVVRAVKPANGWTLLAADSVGWSPVLRAPAATLEQHFEKQGQRVSVHIGFYRDQSQESELVNLRNDLAILIEEPWLFVLSSVQSIDLGQTHARVETALGRRRNEALLVWQWYWIDGIVTTSDGEAKARLALDRLLGRSDTSAWVAVYGIDGEDGRTVRASLQAFAADMGPAIDAALRETAER